MKRQQQTVSVDEIAELEAIAASRPTATPAPAPTEPVVIVGENGMTGVENTCAKHGTPFLRCWVPRLRVNVGQCPDCEAEDKLNAQADAELAKRTSDINAAVRLLEPDYEPEVQQQKAVELEAEIDRYRMEVAPMIEADIRSRLWEQLKAAEVSRMRDEIIAELQSKGA